MEQNLTLATTKSFGSLECDFYKGDDNKEFYMTREQVGTALEYSNPQKAIDNIHQRNADRLNPLSVTLKLRATDNKFYDTKVYTLRGVMEICRYSRQPKADKFMDFVWDVMESLYNGRNVYATPDQQSAVSPQTMQTFMDAMLKTQLETSSCMVAMTNTMSAMADRILNGMIQPVAVATPVETNSENIQPSNLSPENENHETNTEDNPVTVVVEPATTPEPKQSKHYGNTDEWRQKVYDKVNHICANEPYKWPTGTSVLSCIYRKMRDKYGFVVDVELNKYRARHPYSKNPAVITLVQANTTWVEIFESILNDMYDHSITECVRRQDEKKKQSAGMESKPAYPYKKQSPFANEKWHSLTDSALAVTPVKATVAENREKVRDAVVKVSKEYGHRNLNNPYSFKLVYKAMDIDWDEIELNYAENAHAANPTPARYEIVAHSNVLTAIFLAAAEKVINDHKNPKSESEG